MISYQLDNDFSIEFDPPYWWEEIKLTEEELKVDILSTVSPEKAQTSKAQFKFLALRETTPESRSANVYRLFNYAVDINDTALILQVGLSLLDYLYQSQPNESHSLTEIKVGNAFLEGEDLENAKKYYARAAEPKGDSTDHAVAYYQKQAAEKLAALEAIKEEKDYLKIRSAFRNALNILQEDLDNHPEKVKQEQQRLQQLFWRETTAECSNLQLAFLLLIEQDWRSDQPKVFTSDTIDIVQEAMELYYCEDGEGIDFNFEVKPSGVVTYPTELNDDWILSIDGLETIVNIEYNRWDYKDYHLIG